MAPDPLVLVFLLRPMRQPHPSTSPLSLPPPPRSPPLGFLWLLTKSRSDSLEKLLLPSHAPYLSSNLSHAWALNSTQAHDGPDLIVLGMLECWILEQNSAYI